MAQKSPQDQFVAVVKKLTRDIAKHAREGNEHAEKMKLMKAINRAEDRTYRSGLRGDEIAKTFSELRGSALAAEEVAFQVRTSRRTAEAKDLKEKGRLFGYEKEMALGRGGAYGQLNTGVKRRQSEPAEKQDAIVTAIEKFVGDLLK